MVGVGMDLCGDVVVVVIKIPTHQLYLPYTPPRHPALKGYSCKRKPLGQCTREEWMTDFKAFTRLYKGGVLAQELASKAYMCNRTPLDVYGLYSEVCKCGGFRDGTHINWSGKIFPALDNFTPGNKYVAQTLFL